MDKPVVKGGREAKAGNGARASVVHLYLYRLRPSPTLHSHQDLMFLHFPRLLFITLHSLSSGTPFRFSQGLGTLDLSPPEGLCTHASLTIIQLRLLALQALARRTTCCAGCNSFSPSHPVPTLCYPLLQHSITSRGCPDTRPVPCGLSLPCLVLRMS